MSTATLERKPRKARKRALREERLGVVRIDGARHSLIWAYDRERSVSVLIDRPEEDFDAVEALAGDYEEHYVKRPRAERIRPRPVEPADLAQLVSAPPQLALGAGREAIAR